jgi:hypothetical protein
MILHILLKNHMDLLYVGTIQIPRFSIICDMNFPVVCGSYMGKTSWWCLEVYCIDSCSFDLRINNLFCLFLQFKKRHLCLLTIMYRYIVCNDTITDRCGRDLWHTFLAHFTYLLLYWTNEDMRIVRHLCQWHMFKIWFKFL